MKVYWKNHPIQEERKIYIFTFTSIFKDNDNIVLYLISKLEC